MNNKIVRYDATIHAEIAALMKLPHGTNYRKVKLVVIRRELKQSRPCDKCSAVLQTLGINKIYYSDNGQIVRYI